MKTDIFSPFYPETFILRASSGLNTPSVAKKLAVKSSALKKWEKGIEAPPHDILLGLKSLVRVHKENTPGAFTFIDLFAGIGGLRRAFETAGGKCVFTSEWNEKALETYLTNFGADHPVAGDITKIDANDIPDHDILVGGFPCQPFSLAGISQKNATGKPHGFEDKTQGTLFFDVARIIKAKRPATFLLENVRNLISHDKGRTFQVIKDTLEQELGYAVSWKIMDGTPWVPQRRPRIAIVGFRDGEALDFDDIILPTTRAPVLGDILHRPGEPEEADGRFATGGIAHEKYTITDRLWSYLKSHAALHKAKGNGFGYGLHQPNDVARTLTARYYKDGAEILLHQEGKNPRRLTPRECSRLMGFDKASESNFIIPVSDTQAYQQFGNSVIVPMFTEVAKAIVKKLESEQSPTEKTKIAA